MNAVRADPSPDLSDVSIVVLSCNRRDTLQRNLAVLVELVERTGCELIVVDNASADGSRQMIEAVLQCRVGTRFLASGVNLGVAAGRNAGWRLAERDFILNIDDDTLISAGAVATMLAAMQGRPEIGVLSPRIVHAASGIAQFSFEESDPILSNFHGACHMVRRRAIETTGLNDEACRFGGEELDLSIRMRAAGFELGYAADATVLHDNIVREGEADRTRRTQWVQGFTRVMARHFPPGMALAFALRYLAGHCYSGSKAHGLRFAAALVAAAARGLREGRRQYRAIPAHVVQFYRDPGLRPEFGNRPLWRKLSGAWRKPAGG
jgi:GT2 family glycosyltransferase